MASNGYLRATVHRVVTPPAGADRLSVAFFFGARLDASVPLLNLPAELAPGRAWPDAGSAQPAVSRSRQEPSQEPPAVAPRCGAPPSRRPAGGCRARCHADNVSLDHGRTNHHRIRRPAVGNLARPSRGRAQPGALEGSDRPRARRQPGALDRGGRDPAGRNASPAIATPPRRSTICSAARGAWRWMRSSIPPQPGRRSSSLAMRCTRLATLARARSRSCTSFQSTPSPIWCIYLMKDNGGFLPYIRLYRN